MKRLDYEWFKNLTDKELCDVAYLEATCETLSTPSQTRSLLAALAHRLGQGTPRLIRELKEKLKNSHDPNDGSDGL